jgi:hypothetical protein
MRPPRMFSAVSCGLDARGMLPANGCPPPLGRGVAWSRANGPERTCRGPWGTKPWSESFERRLHAGKKLTRRSLGKRIRGRRDGARVPWSGAGCTLPWIRWNGYYSSFCSLFPSPPRRLFA